MSNFVGNLHEDELRLRQKNAFGWGAIALGSVANPMNFVLKNPAASGKTAIITRWMVSCAVANSPELFVANGDPGLAVGGAPQNRFSSGAGSITTEVAIAAIPANFGKYSSVTLAAGIPAELIAPGQYMAFIQNQFFFVSFPALAGNCAVAVNWYELPA